MISLVALQRTFTVRITIRKILTFPIWDYLPLLYKTIFWYIFSFFFIMLQSHILFSPLPNVSVYPMVYTPQLSIYYLLTKFTGIGILWTKGK